MAAKPQVVVYTDGACLGNPGPGGWGVILKYGSHEKTLSGYEKDTTNNRMELQAALEALRALTEPCLVTLFTDSEYLKKGITEWMPGWKRRNWRRKGGKLANVDLWMKLDEEIQRHEIHWQWVRGHAGNVLNERVDQLARGAIKGNS
ncbi:MAG TPA: ribonuclease HI [Anaerolineaceae bacterium]|jgi:ribonuclease HI|nr:ribonuclease HI [Anaerolineaceae bacterium]